MDLNSLLSSVAVVVALVAGGGLGLQRSRVAALRQDIVDERGRSDGFRKDIGDLQSELAAANGKIAQLQSDLRHAEQLVTGESHWAEVDTRLHGIEKHAITIDRTARQTLELLGRMNEGKP